MNILTFISVITVINIVVVGITDMTDWPDTFKKIISFISTKGKVATDRYDCHLLDCSLCQVFHLSNLWLLIYLLAGGAFSPWLFIAPILSALLTTTTKSLLFLMIDILNTVIAAVYAMIK